MIYKEYLRDIQEFEEKLELFKKGEIFESDFKNFRLKHGIYGQRQKGYQMVRVKIPAGIMTPHQMTVLADIADNYSNGVLHITTRQDIQFHWVKLEDVPDIMRKINEVGLTTKEACGNTVRNITTSYLSGICPFELFDVDNIALELTKLILVNPEFEDLPRKFKISFSCCKKHSYLIPFHDIGFIPTKKENNFGFEVYIGGGLGDLPKEAYKLTDYLPIEDLRIIVEVVLKIFNEYGDRKNKRHNRLKFLIEKLGIEEVKKLINEYYIKYKDKIEKFDINIESNNIESIQSLEVINEIIDITDEEYYLWCKTNLISQRQKDYFLANLRIPLGNITSQKFRNLANLIEKYSLKVKNTQEQNIAIYNIHKNKVRDIYLHLKHIGLSNVGSSTIIDITSCPGSETCGLGITNSRALAIEIEKLLPKNEIILDELSSVKIKISGCPNSCAHHHVAPIGLHGVAQKVGDKLIPFYVIHLGGNAEIESTKIGKKIIKIPAKNVPLAIKNLIDFYLENKFYKENFNDFIDRIGIEKIKKLIEKFSLLYNEGIDYAKDWGSEKEFSLEDIGVGECAGIIADRVEALLKEAERIINQAKTHLEKGIKEDSKVHIEKAAELICEALLIPFGIKAEGVNAKDKFIEHIIGRKLINEKFSYFLDSSFNNVEESIKDIEEFYANCRAVYLNLRKESEEKYNGDKNFIEKSRKEILDLRGVECPFNYVQAKMKLREMEVGSILTLIIDGSEALKSVPQSLKDDGHEIIDIQEEKGEYIIVVRKR